jgi:TIR domain
MPENPAQLKHFFISYNKADRTWAEWIAWQLEGAGYRVVIQAWDFRPGCNFVLEMDRATKECARVLAVLSPDYVASLFAQPEWAVYFAQDPTSEKRLIVSVRVREVELKTHRSKRQCRRGDDRA